MTLTTDVMLVIDSPMKMQEVGLCLVTGMDDTNFLNDLIIVYIII